MISLSAVETDQQRNIVVYTSGGRAILAMEKGTPGDRAFAEAFAAWNSECNWLEERPKR